MSSVASVLHGHQGQAPRPHAMVLDKFYDEHDMLIFKNTYSDQENGLTKQFKIKRTDPNSPEELYFVHIEIKDMDTLPDKSSDSDDESSTNSDQESDSDKINLLRTQATKGSVFSNTFKPKNYSQYLQQQKIEIIRLMQKCLNQ